MQTRISGETETQADSNQKRVQFRIAEKPYLVHDIYVASWNDRTRPNPILPFAQKAASSPRLDEERSCPLDLVVPLNHALVSGSFIVSRWDFSVKLLTIWAAGARGLLSRGERSIVPLRSRVGSGHIDIVIAHVLVVCIDVVAVARVGRVTLDVALGNTMVRVTLGVDDRVVV